MSASLIVLIPLVLAGLVGTLCFIGCGYPDFQFNTSLEQSVVSNPNALAFWPLDDAAGSTTAAESINPFNGTYTAGPTGAVTPGQPGFVLGNVDDKNAIRPCASFKGGFVNVSPFHAKLNPQPPFSVECWVQPAWSASDKNIHAVVVTTDLTAGTGYSLFCDSNNFWGAVVGFGPATPFLQTTPIAGSQPFMPGTDTSTVFYLVLTFANGILQVFVNGSLYAQAVQMAGTTFAPSVSPPLFIGMGRPDLLQMGQEQYPFIGQIQDVALYSTNLDNATIVNHFSLGMPSTG